MAAPHSQKKAIQLASERRRLCGYRKIGALYLVSDGAMEPCGLLPRRLEICPTCGHGLKANRGFQWVRAELISYPTDVRGCDYCIGTVEGIPTVALRCVMRSLVKTPEQILGLLWVGGTYYRTAAHFIEEARVQGISRRVSTVPKGLELGKTWVLLAHRRVVVLDADGAVPAIFGMFRPTRIEMLITEEHAADGYYISGLVRRGITPVAVPTNDTDHNPDAVPQLELDLATGPPMDDWKRDRYGGPVSTKGMGACG